MHRALTNKRKQDVAEMTARIENEQKQLEVALARQKELETALEKANKDAAQTGETNKALEQDPALVNRDPYGQGWMIKVKVKNAKELEGLLRADAYAKHIGE